MKHEPTRDYIEHNPHEKRQPWWLWWVAWAFVGVLWLAQTLTDGFDWDQIALGGITGMFLVAWVADTAGLDIPESWRRKTVRKR